MLNCAYLNGQKLTDRNQLSIYNGSFLYGINCFEGIRAYWNDSKAQLFVFDLNEHLDRLYRSIAALDFVEPIAQEYLKTQLFEIFEQEQIREDSYIRITFFIDGETSWSERENISCLISIRSMSSNLSNAESQRLGWSSFNRIAGDSMPPSVKAGANYLNSRYALLDTKKRGFDGALFLSSKGFVSESTGSCIFFIKSGILYTPSTDADILVGVTRNRIVQLAAELGIKVVEKLIRPEELNDFEAAFLAGTMIELKPISIIEDLEFNPNHHVYHQIAKALKKYVYNLEF